MIELRVLGTLDIAAPGQSSAPELLSKASPTALLVYLAVASPGSFHRRDHLVGLFWPETSQPQARANLRKLIHTLRTGLHTDAIESRGDEEVRLSADCVWCDAAEFQASLRAGRLSRAMELYRGRLLPGFFLENAGEFSRWLDETRRDLAREAGKAAVRLADEHLHASERTEASDLAQIIARIGGDIDDEFLFRKLLQLLAQLGDHAGALSLYDGFRRRLQRQYGALPSPETRALVDAIRAR
jgi:DNA-binding SARP family transcriptional activator